jgi:hypothetical protein
VAGTSIIWKREVFYCNFASIMHSFVYIEVLLLTRNDVIAKYLPGGASGDPYKL